MDPGQLVILLVEDDEHDVFFLRRATEEITHGPFLCAVSNGQEAISYLTGARPFADRTKFPFPNLLLTDLKMPIMNGFQLLSWLKATPGYGLLPTIVYTSSHFHEDVVRAYRSGANSFITKPTQFTEMVRVLRMLCEYWGLCQIPRLSGCEGVAES